MNWVVLLSLLQVGVTSDDEILITVSGSSQIDYVHRDDAIPDLRAFLNGPGSYQFGGLMRAEAYLGLDVHLGNELNLVVELESSAWDNDKDIPLADGLTNNIALEQLRLEIGSLFSPDLSLSMGLQDFSYRLRPTSEPFFMGAGTSESFFSGTSSLVRNTADKSRLGAGGISIRYNPNLVLELEFWCATLLERGPTHDDESLYGLLLNGLLSERTSWNLMSTLVTGDGSDREIWTIGLGLDHYLTPSRSLELFVEAYAQFGSLNESTDREAGAIHCGAAWYGKGFWLEGAFSLRTGDSNPSDGTEKTFQSYENVNQFAILESASLGLDIDTNVYSFRLAGEVALLDQLFLRVDAGNFHFHKKVRDSSGAVLTSNRDLGFEVDLTFRYEINPLVGFSITGAALHSDFLEETIRESTTVLFSSAVQIRF